MSRKKLTGALAAVAALWVVNNAIIAFDGAGFDEAKECISTFGHDPDEYRLLGADSEVGLLGRSVEARYVPIDGGGQAIRVRASRSLAFTPWQLREFELIDRDEDDD
ncbi:MAG: hypothetical protein AAF726_11740 [Planctomycetota bacterium]